MDLSRLFRPLADDLIALLNNIPESEWDNRTCYPTWRVRNIVGHLAQTAMSRLSAQRDRLREISPAKTPSFVALSSIIGDANDAFAQFSDRLSHTVLRDLVSLYEPQLTELLESADPNERATYAVSWAGEVESSMGFDIAREFTERWHHQQQIREAVGATSITHKNYLQPVLRILALCLPYWFQSVAADPGSEVAVNITGASGGRWVLCRDVDHWRLDEREPDKMEASITIADDMAWRHWTRSIAPRETSKHVKVDGDKYFTSAFLESKAVMIND